MSYYIAEMILSQQMPLGDLSPLERSHFLKQVATGKVAVSPGVEREHLIRLLVGGFFKPGCKDYAEVDEILKTFGADQVMGMVSDKAGARIFLDVFGVEAGHDLPKHLLNLAKGQHLEDALGL